jgi:hypothetical protein
MTEPSNMGELLRRTLLRAALSQLCQIDVDAVHSPVCPFCQEGPIMALPGGQAFCGNDDCSVFTWQITDTPEQFRQKAKKIRIQTRNPDGTWQDVPEDELPPNWPF